MISPSVATSCAVKKESHTLLCARREEDRFIVPTRQAADFIRARQCGIRADILQNKTINYQLPNIESYMKRSLWQ